MSGAQKDRFGVLGHPHNYCYQWSNSKYTWAVSESTTSGQHKSKAVASMKSSRAGHSFYSFPGLYHLSFPFGTFAPAMCDQSASSCARCAA
jgi:hypothetical protein